MVIYIVWLGVCVCVCVRWIRNLCSLMFAKSFLY